MSISAGVIVAVALKQIDGSPDAQACTKGDNESLKYGYCRVKECHKRFLLYPSTVCGMRASVIDLINKMPLSQPHVHLQPEEGQKNSRS